MSVTSTQHTRGPGEPAPRVRELAWAAVLRMVFSAGVSVALALCLLLLAYGAGR